MQGFKTFTFFLIIGLISLSTACKKNKDKNDPVDIEFDRKTMLSNITTQYILPAYANYTNKAELLKQSVITFNSNQGVEALINMRNNLVSLATAWQGVAFLEFGPAANIGLRSQTNIFPCDTNKINNNIYNNNYDLASAANYTAKGIQAIDYLINKPNQSDSSNVLSFSTNQNTSNYLLNLTAELFDNASIVKTAWDSYSNEFIENNSSTSQGSAVSDLVNALSAHFETFVRKGKVGIPLGVFNGFSQITLPEKAELYYGGQSFEMLNASLISIEKLIFGIGFETNINGLGLDDYMNFVGAKNSNEDLSITINNQINNIKIKLETFSIPFEQAINNDKVAMDALYQELQKLVPLIKVDLTSALGILITYQDNDGD